MIGKFYFKFIFKDIKGNTANFFDIINNDK